MAADTKGYHQRPLLKIYNQLSYTRPTMTARRRGKKPRTKRPHRFVLMLSNEELEALNNYCTCYGKSSDTRAGIVRELLMSHMIQRYEQDSPMLFSEEEMC